MCPSIKSSVGVLAVKADGSWNREPWFKQNFTYSKKNQLNAAQTVLGERTLRDAVKRQMVSDVPVGAFLSGGLDSTSVVAFARELNPSIQCLL